jgi:nicotinamidase-related amidase
LQDYCLYYLEKLREEDRRLVIQPFKRNVLLIIHPQNDFHDKMSDKTNIAQDRLQHEDAAKKSAKTPFAVNDVVSLRDLKDGRDVVYTIVHINEHDSTADLRYEDSEFSPTLPVTGAYEDSLRIAELINNQWEHIDEIFVTQDTHFKNHISNRWYWKKGENAPEDLATMDGAHPPPFTAIKHDHIRDKIWVPDFSTGECGLMTRKEVEDERYGYSLYYTAELERQKKFLHFIWPDHCIVGSSDHEVTYEERERLSCTSLTADDGRKDEPDPNLSIEDCFTSQGHHIIITIQEALANWRRNWQEKEHVHKRVKYVRTGTNANTEMYSVLRAEVADSRDVLTGLNKRFLSDINSADKLYVCGQALSHCVNYTLRDLFKYWIRKPSDITLLVDGSSAVGGFEQAAYEFIKEMKDEGIRLRTCEAVNKHLGGLKRVHRGGGAACRHDGCTGWNAPQKQFPNDPLFVEIDGAS